MEDYHHVIEQNMPKVKQSIRISGYQTKYKNMMLPNQWPRICLCAASWIFITIARVTLQNFKVHFCKISRAQKYKFQFAL